MTIRHMRDKQLFTRTKSLWGKTPRSRRKVTIARNSLFSPRRILKTRRRSVTKSKLSTPPPDNPSSQLPTNSGRTTKTRPSMIKAISRHMPKKKRLNTLKTKTNPTGETKHPTSRPTLRTTCQSIQKTCESRRRRPTTLKQYIPRMETTSSLATLRLTQINLPSKAITPSKGGRVSDLLDYPQWQRLAMRAILNSRASTVGLTNQDRCIPSHRCPLLLRMFRCGVSAARGYLLSLLVPSRNERWRKTGT
mmetsp:Transcript_7393/g.12274  ORF Transcript_7393/g.12274 Transcript_7393/m.12274 type:complete len:249 (-) Transcript_7393:1255-2001(-)